MQIKTAQSSLPNRHCPQRLLRRLDVSGWYALGGGQTQRYLWPLFFFFFLSQQLIYRHILVHVRWRSRYCTISINLSVTRHGPSDFGEISWPSRITVADGRIHLANQPKKSTKNRRKFGILGACHGDFRPRPKPKFRPMCHASHLWAN